MSLFSVRAYSGACRELAALAYRHRQLTWEMARREITDRYAGQVLGSLWAIAHPLVLIGVYVFIFAFVFQPDIGKDMPLDYTVYLLAGLLPWMACAEVMNKGVVSLTGNANLVKQVVFPLEVLPLKGVLSTLFTQVVSLVLLSGYILVRYQTLPWTFALVPLVLVLEASFLLGLSCLLASVGPYFRDLKDFVQVFSVVGVYVIPVMYTPAMMPALFRPLLHFNPFSYLIWCFQDACYYGSIEHPEAWAGLVVLALGSFALGYRAFRKLKPMLGNVL